MPLEIQENLLGVLVKASRVLIYDLLLSYKECLSRIYWQQLQEMS